MPTKIKTKDLLIVIHESIKQCSRSYVQCALWRRKRLKFVTCATALCANKSETVEKLVSGSRKRYTFIAINFQI